MVWFKEKDLDKAVWVNQVVSFLQSFHFMIELLVFHDTTSNCAALADFVVV